MPYGCSLLPERPSCDQRVIFSLGPFDAVGNHSPSGRVLKPALTPSVVRRLVGRPARAPERIGAVVEHDRLADVMAGRDVLRLREADTKATAREFEQACAGCDWRTVIVDHAACGRARPRTRPIPATAAFTSTTSAASPSATSKTGSTPSSATTGAATHPQPTTTSGTDPHATDATQRPATTQSLLPGDYRRLRSSRMIYPSFTEARAKRRPQCENCDSQRTDIFLQNGGQLALPSATSINRRSFGPSRPAVLGGTRGLRD